MIKHMSIFDSPHSGGFRHDNPTYFHGTGKYLKNNNTF